jgi:molybdopterin-containing oxidoreductase family iron-sulfur binding subunit
MSQEKRGDYSAPVWADQLREVEAAGDLDRPQITVEFEDGSEPLTVSRRDFLRVASAAAAASGLVASGCDDLREPQDKIVPYVKRPEDVYHGTPNTYTTACRGCSASCGAIMVVREGRVLKLEGNPDHPVSQGALCARGQYSVTEVYDPARLRAPQASGADSTWDALDAAVAGALKTASKVRLLTKPLGGPGERALAAAFLGRFADGKLVEWEPTAPTATVRAYEKAYGEGFLPRHRFDKAQAIVSFGSEFLDTWLSPVEFQAQFSKTRDPDGKQLSRLTVFESRMSITGAASDIRHRVSPNDMLYVALSVAHELILGGNLPQAGDPNVKAALSGYAPADLAPKVGLEPKTIQDAAASLKNAGKAGLAVAGRSTGGADSVRLEAVVALINEALGAVGTTVEHKRSNQGAVKFADVKALVNDLNGGGVEVLIVHGLNPLFDGQGAGLAEAAKKAKLLVAIHTHPTETTAAAAWTAAAAHPLESWGDTEPFEGVFTLQQPGMQPLHGARSWADSLIAWSKGAGVAPFDAAQKASDDYKDPLKRPSPGPWHFFLKAHWTTQLFAQVRSPMGAESFWEDVARGGVFVSRAASETKKRTFDAKALEGIPGTRPDGAGDQLEIFAPIGLHDGRWADNPFLQEMPDPITHASWMHYVGVSPKRYTELGLKPGDYVKLTVGAASIEVQAHLMPGLPDNTFATPLGYGRGIAGVVGKDMGQNSYSLTSAGEDGVLYTGLPVTLAPTGRNEEPGLPRGSTPVLDQDRRYLVPHTTLPAYQKDRSSGAPKFNHPGIWGDVHRYEGLKWSMTVDLSKCTGCSACVAACQVENNIPVVGRQGVIEGRLMHWLRMDRYFILPPGRDYEHELLQEAPDVAAAQYLTNPHTLFQPVMCQHCDNAPCESVCPVAATVHSTEGLNEQVYNRCVGTRYCANNCPYKMRRFNWYAFNKDRSDSFVAGPFPEVGLLTKFNALWPRPLGFNPEVTVRSRGVMEKCSFCVQRLRKATKVYRKRGMFEQEPQTACQQTCPSQAISFGNVLDEKSAISQNFNGERAFTLLEPVNTKPAVRYLTRVRNVDEAPPTQG